MYINKEIHMPKELYVSNSFNLNFDSNGIIKSFDTYLYGKNDKDELESYLIDYNSSKSENITIYLNGHVNADGIVYVNSEGKTKAATNASSEIIGYVVSVFVPVRRRRKNMGVFKRSYSRLIISLELL